jgi:hypothetical protein
METNKTRIVCVVLTQEHAVWYRFGEEESVVSQEQ